MQLANANRVRIWVPEYTDIDEQFVNEIKSKGGLSELTQNDIRKYLKGPMKKPAEPTKMQMKSSFFDDDE